MLMVVLHGFQKNSQKTPQEEIRKAEKLKKEYYEQEK
jgi:phage-related protein